MAKRALIVDDSKTAQARLRKMLEKFDVEVDTSSSAEEALGYLSYRQPAVIFLDHHMDGMSGLAALKIIKSNPATALIPVVMYTSEQGDVYVGQARALGALDIISKEVVQPSSIEKVLSGLGLMPPEGNKAVAGKTTQTSSRRSAAQDDIRPVTLKQSAAPASLDDLPPRHSEAELIKVQAQVGKLFEIHMTKVRQEIEDSTKFLLRRLSKDIQEAGAARLGGAKKAEKADGTIPTLEQPAEEKPAKRGPSILFPSLVFLAIVFVIYQIYASRLEQSNSNSQLEQLASQSDKQNSLVTRVLEQLADERRAVALSGPDPRVMLDALSWAVNVDPIVPFGQQALNDERIYVLGELLSLLKAANFKGTIFVDVNLGNFCVIGSPATGWQLPAPDSSLTDCRFLQDIDTETTLDSQVSVGFLNYLHSTPVLVSGGIEVELSNLGYDTPRFSYPSTTSATSAGEWNDAAARNNRLAFGFSPDY